MVKPEEKHEQGAVVATETFPPAAPESAAPVETAQAKDEKKDETEPAADSRVPTEYVVLRRDEDLGAWVEVGQVAGFSRAAAFDEAKRQAPELVPTVSGEVVRVQLVPARSWRAVKVSVITAAPQTLVEGL